MAVEKVALAPLSGSVRKVTPPSRRSTVPPGIPAPVRTDTVAVNVTDVPKGDGLRLLVRAVEVVPWPTTWVTEPELVPKAASPRRWL